jgi:cytochrome c-type biogenesis protein CcmH
MPFASSRPSSRRIAAVLGLVVSAVIMQPAQAQTPGAAADSAPATQAGAAAGAPVGADDLAKTERFRRLASELRCLVCQNQSLVDSNAPLAQDLRNEVVKLMASGRDDGQIKSFLVDRYGEFVLYRPTLSLRNALLWLGPFLLLVAGAVAWWRLGRRRPAPAQSAQEALQHVDELLGPRH